MATTKQQNGPRTALTGVILRGSTVSGLEGSAQMPRDHSYPIIKPANASLEPKRSAYIPHFMFSIMRVSAKSLYTRRIGETHRWRNYVVILRCS